MADSVRRAAAPTRHRTVWVAVELRAGADTPRPMPFAIMRNAHEALRVSIKLQQHALDAGDEAAFREEWTTFQRGLAVHMAMEDDAMFGLLDEVGGGAITAAKIPQEHVEDTRLAAAVGAALGTSDPQVLRAACGAARSPPPNCCNSTWAAWHA